MQRLIHLLPFEVSNTRLAINVTTFRLHRIPEDVITLQAEVSLIDGAFVVGWYCVPWHQVRVFSSLCNRFRVHYLRMRRWYIHISIWESEVSVEQTLMSCEYLRHRFLVSISQYVCNKCMGHSTSIKHITALRGRTWSYENIKDTAKWKKVLRGKNNTNFSTHPPKWSRKSLRRELVSIISIPFVNEWPVHRSFRKLASELSCSLEEKVPWGPGSLSLHFEMKKGYFLYWFHFTFINRNIKENFCFASVSVTIYLS